MRTPEMKAAGVALALADLRTQPRPRVVVETGTHRGQLAVLLPRMFEVVHTVERSPELYASRPKDSRVWWHHGDSREKVAELADTYRDEPVFWLLDAHYFDAKHAAGANDLPLWEEIALISARRQPDLVAVDDVHTFGKKRPERFGRWDLVTTDSLKLKLERVTHSEAICDMFIMWRSACS